MEKFITTLGLVVLTATLGCGNTNSESNGYTQSPAFAIPKEKLVSVPVSQTNLKVPHGVSIAVTIPQATGRRVTAARQVPEKTLPLSAFNRTLESTPLVFKIALSKSVFSKGEVPVKLMSGGVVIQSTSENTDATSDLSIELANVRTPFLTRDQRSAGFGVITYEFIIGSDSSQIRVPFQVAVYDQYQPTYVVPAQGACLEYLQPERVSGCYQNRTRTTQEVVFNDSITNTHELDVQFSGGLSIPISIVGFSFNASRTSLNSTSVSNGSEIHFTNCILCSSVIYRQEVKSIRKGDVYQVMADGSLTLAGETTVTSKQLAYEFTSTGSESQNYNCDIQSQLPVGYSAGCSQ
jgi:hypothetical protein